MVRNTKIAATTIRPAIARRAPSTLRASPASLAPATSPIEARVPIGIRRHANPQRCRSEEHTSELQSRLHLVCRLLLEKKKREARHTGAMERDLVAAPARPRLDV